MPLNEKFVITKEFREQFSIGKSTTEAIVKETIEGVHWVWALVPGGKRLWNLRLMIDWFANRHQQDIHNQAIDEYMASLPSSRSARSRKKYFK